jgi:hypothetical protein
MKSEWMPENPCSSLCAANQDAGLSCEHIGTCVTFGQYYGGVEAQKKLLEYLIAHKPWVNTGTMNLIEMLKQLEAK